MGLNVCQVCIVRGTHEDDDGAGEGRHAWNYVKLPGSGVFLLDLTREPGTLHKTDMRNYKPECLTPNLKSNQVRYPDGPQVGGLDTPPKSPSPPPCVAPAWLDEDIEI